MEINLNKKGRIKKAEKGDLIQFEDSAICLVTEENTLVLLHNYKSETCCIVLSTGSLYVSKEFNNREYIILAKADEWEINMMK